jgi:hypothetical protein
VVIKIQQIVFVMDHHPVCAGQDATRHFLDRAATPPRRGGECSHSSFITPSDNRLMHDGFHGMVHA